MGEPFFGPINPNGCLRVIVRHDNMAYAKQRFRNEIFYHSMHKSLRFLETKSSHSWHHAATKLREKMEKLEWTGEVERLLSHSAYVEVVF